MNQQITFTVHIQRMEKKTDELLYRVVLEYQQGFNMLVDDNHGYGWQLYQAENLFAVLQKTCVGEYEIPKKVVRCDIV